jgi:hypothetical protein
MNYLYGGTSRNFGRFGMIQQGDIIDLTPAEIASFGADVLFAAIPTPNKRRRIVTTDYQAVATDQVIDVNHTAAALVTLPIAPPFGTAIEVFDVSSAGASVNTITIDSAAELILGESSAVASVTVGAAGTGFTSKPTLVFGGDGTLAAGAPLMKALTAVPVAPGTGYVPAEVITLAAGTGTAAKAAVATTKVVSATINAAGTGGTPGTATVTGTTGTGTKFTASVTIDGTGVITAVLSILTGGSYTTNPTTIGQEPVTGGALTGAKLAVVMGVNTATINTAGSYSVLPPIPATQASTTGSGTGATLTMTWGILSVTMSVLGSGYTAATCATSGGGGSGATLTPVLTSADETIITDGGRKGYIYDSVRWRNW